MTSPRTGEWPSDPDGLAAIARDGSRPQEQRDRAVRELLPIIRRAARRVAARFAGWCSADLLDEAPGQVWPALGGYEPGKSFEAWCYGVLRHYLLTQLRKEQRERSHRSDVVVESQGVELQRALEKALDLQNSLPQADLAVVRGWPIAQRLAVLALSGLWLHVPQAEWSAWIAEYRTTRDVPLPDPFPPGSLAECDSLAERNAVLCEALEVPRNTLSVWLHRRKPMLRAMQYVRDLLENS
jgi:DNA-directed RNA polymerase specialized sigma24 family protein